MSTLYYESSFAHHGIKGQKWGVRRFQNPDGTLTKAGRDRSGKPKLSSDYKTKLRTSAMIDGGTIPKGTIMFRTTPNADETTDGIKYATYIESDRNFYRGYYADGIRNQYGKNGNASLYEKQLHTTEELKIPSRETVKSVYKEVLSDPKVLSKSVTNFYKEMESRDKFNYFRDHDVYWDSSKEDKAAAEKAWAKELTKRGETATKEYLKKYGDKAVDRAFLEVSTALGTLPDVKKSIVDKLSKQGYNAMVDEAGVGGKLEGWGREGVNPIIVFDGKKSLADDSTSRITKKVQSKATVKAERWKQYANSDANRRNPW